MNTIFLLIFLLSIPTLIVGLIKPSILRLASRKLVGVVAGSTFVGSFVLFGITMPPSQTSPSLIEEKTILVETSTSTPEIKVATSTATTTEVKPVATQPTKTATSAPKQESQYTYYSVTEVVDGDTLKVSINGTIETLRLIGMDTTETVDPRKPVQCFGKEASNKAKELLAGKKVRLGKDSTQGDKDKYGRTLAYIYLESGLFYNKYMIEQGYAHEYTYNTPYKYQAEFKAAEKSAQTAQLGLWSPNTCNGDTTQTETVTTVTTPQSSGVYYTSSASNATRYYPDTCKAWQDLSKANLKSFNSLDVLLAVYPKRTLADACK